MTFERTRNFALIKHIATHPWIYPRISDDGAPAPRDWEPLQNEAIWYVLAMDGREILGFCAFFPENSVTWRAHICFTPNAYGSRTKQASRELVEWMWGNSPCQRIIGAIPLSNKLALRMVESAGFQPFGFDDASYLKNGVLEPRVAVGISRPAA